VATLNPWLFKGRDELVEAYFNSLREALGYSASEKTRKLLRQLERYKASIEFVGTTTAGIIDVIVGAERWSTLATNPSHRQIDLAHLVTVPTKLPLPQRRGPKTFSGVRDGYPSVGNLEKASLDTLRC
jgi:hypothetical protein